MERIVAPIEILLVEDNIGDIELARAALKNLKVPNRVSVVQDGDSALAFLSKTEDYADAPRPDLILLDLNLPGLNGREVLAELKGDPGLKRIPVLVLTTSSAETDIAASYDLHANGYIPKPIGISGLTEVVTAIEDFWFSVALLPRT